MKRVKLSNGCYSSCGDLAIYDVQASGLLKRGYILTDNYHEADIVILGGGGLLYQRNSQIDKEFFRLKCDMHFEDIAASIYYSDAKFYVMGSGWQGYECNEQVKQSWHDLMLMCSGFSIRTYGCAEAMLSDLSLTRDMLAGPIQIYPDMAFAHFRDSSKCEWSGDYVLFSVTWPVVEKYDKYFRLLLDGIRNLGYRIILYPFSSGDYESYKNNWIKEYGRIVARTFNGQFFPDYYTYLELGTMSAAAITTRMHGLIFGIDVQLPTLSIISNTERIDMFGELRNTKNEFLISDIFPDSTYKYRVLADENLLDNFIGLIHDSRDIRSMFYSIGKSCSVLVDKHFDIMKEYHDW